MLIKPLMFIAAFSLFLWLAPVTQVFAGPITITIDPAVPAGCTTAAAVTVSQVFKVTFNVPVEANLSNVDLTKITINDGTGTGNLDLRFFQGADRKSITFAPTDFLEYDHDYTLNIDPGVITGSTLLINVAFHTAYDLPTLIKGTLNTVIQNNSPRTLNVFVPKKYMTTLTVSTTKIPEIDNPVTEVDIPLTNVDIKAEAEVDSIAVLIAGRVTQQAIKSGTVWNAGFSDSIITSDDDITFVAMDKYGRTLETKIIKYNPLGSKDDLSSFKSLSAKKTLADLILIDGKLFKAILVPYTIDDLSIGIIAR